MTVPDEFVPEGYLGLTDYTEDDLPALAEKIGDDTNHPADEILDQLDTLVNEYNVPVAGAERSVRIQYGEEEVRRINDPDLPEKYGWDR